MRLGKPKEQKESKVMKVVNMAGTTIMLNLMFLIACIPVVTIGPAFSGLYSGVRYMIRKDGAAAGFWEGFKTNFVRMMITGVIFTGIMAYMCYQFNGELMAYLGLWEGVETTLTNVIIHGILGMLPMMLFVSLIPLNIYIPYRVTDWLKNGVNLIFMAPLWVLLSAAMGIFPVACILWMTDIAILGIMIFVAAWFSLLAFISTLFLKDSLIELLELFREEYDYDDEEEEEDV